MTRVQAALATEAGLEARAALLDEPHVRPIEAWRAAHHGPDRPLPHVDPADGGVEARVLLLLETPGPGAAPLRFVSRDNPTGTGANLRRFLGEAEIARRDLVIWNAVPWIVHAPGARNRAVRVGEVRDGLAMLPGFLRLLPDLRVVVLSGRVAGMAEPVVHAARPEAAVLRMPHPSPTVVCTSPQVPARIQATLAEAAALLDQQVTAQP